MWELRKLRTSLTELAQLATPTGTRALRRHYCTYPRTGRTAESDSKILTTRSALRMNVVRDIADIDAQRCRGSLHLMVIAPRFSLLMQDGTQAALCTWPQELPARYEIISALRQSIKGMAPADCGRMGSLRRTQSNGRRS